MVQIGGNIGQPEDVSETAGLGQESESREVFPHLSAGTLPCSWLRLEPWHHMEGSMALMLLCLSLSLLLYVMKSQYGSSDNVYALKHTLKSASVSRMMTAEETPGHSVSLRVQRGRAVRCLSGPASTILVSLWGLNAQPQGSRSSSPAMEPEEVESSVGSSAFCPEPRL